MYIFAQIPQSNAAFPVEKRIFKWRKEAASTVLTLTPSGKIIISTVLLPESHYKKMKLDVWSMHCESHSSAIWRKPKGCKEKTLDCLIDINFIKTHEPLQNCLSQTSSSFKIIFPLNTIPSCLFHACMLNIITFFCREPLKLAAMGSYSLQQWSGKCF